MVADDNDGRRGRSVELDLTRKQLKRLAQASSLKSLPWKAGEAFTACVYSDAKQRLYFFGQDASDADTLHFITLSDLGEGLGAIRVGGTQGEDHHDRFYGGTRVTSMVFNSTGDRLLLSGPPSQTSPYLGVVDLQHEEVSTRSISGVARIPHRQLLPHDLRGRLLKAAWHPLSKWHVVVLLGPEHGPQSAQGAELRVYDLSSESREPEQVIELDPDVTSFCFGPDTLWQRFTIYLVGSGLRSPPEGGVSPPRLLALCPVIPYRAHVPALAIKELQQMMAEELALDKISRRREELEEQWALLTRCFGDVVELAKDRGIEFLSLRWVTNRTVIERKPTLQEIDYPNPPTYLPTLTDPNPPVVGGGRGGQQEKLWPFSMDLLNPRGTLPAFAITYDQDVIDIMLLVSLVEPQLERGGAYDMNAVQPWVFESRRLAKLKIGHGRETESLPQLLLDPERHVHGTFFVVRDRSILRVVVPWIRRLEELGGQGMEGGVRGLPRGPPGKTKMKEVHRLRSSAGRDDREVRTAGACIVYNASVGSLLIVRRRDGEVDVLNLAILPFMDGWDKNEKGVPQKQDGANFSNYVSFEAASQTDLERLKQGYQALSNGGSPSTSEIANLKQDLIERVIIPLRALQTRMVIRADEVAVLYERAHAAAKTLNQRLQQQRIDFTALVNKVDKAEKQLEQDQQVAKVAGDRLKWVRSVITPREDRQFQEVQLAESRLKNLEEKLKVVEEWVQKEKADGRGVDRGMDNAEEARRRLIAEVQEVARDVAILEHVYDDDGGMRGPGLEVLDGMNALRL